MSSKKALRPGIPSIDVGSEVHPAEQFQNEVLRPILKFQNEFLMHFFWDYVNSKNKKFLELSEEKKSDWIDSAFSKDHVLKNQCIGMVIGLIEEGEASMYFKFKSELNKRILQMAKQRIKDNLTVPEP